ncbi:hypothetical protein [Thermoflexibacter ruber]|uniref:Uncharacterized protein n=1 Tax=Thermoflexibacter ruber TaxID=1003 RepID=A0A1I2JUL9_9BACT|nr:hypothetical protein [Thermoflexibacter ruber]SFF56827.1 hypothetical protein SAMN04488541_106013 [Thermoflexibacter ruber]
MKKLSLNEMAAVNGGYIPDSFCASAGATLALGMALVGAAIVTGGVGLAVAGGLGMYFGNIGGLLCLMGGSK